MIFLKINYPNGQSFSTEKKEKSSQPKRAINFANRGMTFEAEINQTNQYYLDWGIAVIHKKPTPVQIVKVDYPKRSAAVIKEAYFKEASTTDYNGIYQGRYIDFEAKETKNKTSFPLSNFHEHQIKHMSHCLNQKGIVFVLICFSSNKTYYLVSASLIIDYWKNQETGGRKSIPLAAIKEHGYEINPGYAPRIPYLSILDQHFLKGDYSNDK